MNSQIKYFFFPFRYVKTNQWTYISPSTTTKYKLPKARLSREEDNQGFFKAFVNRDHFLL